MIIAGAFVALISTWDYKQRKNFLKVQIWLTISSDWYFIFYRAHCFCGNSYGRHGKNSESECYFGCTGNSSQVCGAAYINSIYAV